MKSLLLLTLAPLALCGVTFHSPLDFLYLKRDYLSCQQTYGGSSVTCGNSTSHFCYDPALDEVILFPFPCPIKSIFIEGNTRMLIDRIELLPPRRRLLQVWRLLRPSGGVLLS
jgi:hypothetical protein